MAISGQGTGLGTSRPSMRSNTSASPISKKSKKKFKGKGNAATKSSIMDLKNHVIVCGDMGSHVAGILHRFHGQKEVLFLSTKSIDKLGISSDDYSFHFLQGDMTIGSDLAYARVKHASHIIILSSRPSDKKQSDGSDLVMDAKALLTYKLAKRKNPKIKAILQLTYFRPSSNSARDQGNSTDTLLPPINWADQDQKVALLELVGGGPMRSPAYASGSIFLQSILDNLVVTDLLNPNIRHFVEMLMNSERLKTIKIDDDLITDGFKSTPLTYEDVFFHLLAKNIILVALYRRNPAPRKGEEKNHYVVTTPPLSTPLRDSDRFIILHKHRQQVSYYL